MATKKATATAVKILVQPKTVVSLTAKMLLVSGVVAVFLTWLLH